MNSHLVHGVLEGRGRRTAALLAAMIALMCTMIVWPGRSVQADSSDSHALATWNMQAGSSRWDGAFNLARTRDVVALQEVPGRPPAGARLLRTVNGVQEYQWRPTSRDPVRYLYILPQQSRNLGMVTSWRADEVVPIAGSYRYALGVVNNVTGTLIASVHASSSGGGDARTLIDRVQARARARNWDWVAVGDFNRDPARLSLPRDTYLYNSGQATQASGNELDYAVSNVETDRWQATVDNNAGSDHWPVAFGSLLGSAGPATVTIHNDGTDGTGRNLDVLRLNANGAPVIVASPNNGRNQRWKLEPLIDRASDGDTLYRIVSQDSKRCLDVKDGQQSGAGSIFHVWKCHGPDGSPEPGGPSRDSQNFTLEHPDRFRPNLTVLRDNSTRMSAQVLRGGQDSQVVQNWLGILPLPNQTFYLHPEISRQR